MGNGPFVVVVLIESRKYSRLSGKRLIAGATLVEIRALSFLFIAPMERFATEIATGKTLSLRAANSQSAKQIPVWPIR
jgi:hypothetical protein